MVKTDQSGCVNFFDFCNSTSEECISDLAVILSRLLENVHTVTQTKTMIFSCGKVTKVPHLSFHRKTIEVVWDYRYLG